MGQTREETAGNGEPSPGEAVPQEGQEREDAVDLPSGTDMGPEETAEVMRRAITRVVVLAGPADSGKTTLLVSIYDKFLEGPFADFLFAGSRSLLAFEERCYPSRIASGRTTPDTERTKSFQRGRFLHLCVHHDEPEGAPLDMLLTDLPGEVFDQAKDSTDACKNEHAFKRADHFAILIDGGKLADRKTRAAVMTDCESLLRSCLDASMLDEHAFVEVLFSKWDLVLKADDRDTVLQRVSALEDRV